MFLSVVEDPCLNGSLKCFRWGVDKSNGRLNGVLVSPEGPCKADSSSEEELANDGPRSSRIGRFVSMSIFEVSSCVGCVDIATITRHFSGGVSGVGSDRDET